QHFTFLPANSTYPTRPKRGTKTPVVIATARQPYVAEGKTRLTMVGMATIAVPKCKRMTQTIFANGGLVEPTGTPKNSKTATDHTKSRERGGTSQKELQSFDLLQAERRRGKELEGRKEICCFVPSGAASRPVDPATTLYNVAFKKQDLVYHDAAFDVPGRGAAFRLAVLIPKLLASA
ncbi:6306_t:CDS:2, partial [Acaulospora colombiana]